MYAKGETVTVTATVNPGYVFLGWYDASGKLVNANTSYTLSQHSRAIKMLSCPSVSAAVSLPSAAM